MGKGYLSFGQRIFLYIFGLILFFTISITIATYYHFSRTSRDYHINLVDSKKSAIIKSIEYLIDSSPEMVDESNVTEILNNRIFELRDVNGTHINVFSLAGELLLTTEPFNSENTVVTLEKNKILSQINGESDYITLRMPSQKGEEYLESYRYIYNNILEPIAILNLPYHSDNTFFKTEYFSLLKVLWIVMAILSVIVLLAAWFLSFNLTRRLTIISEKIKRADVLTNAENLNYDGNDEISVLIDSYNEMLAKVKDQSEKLLQIEREDAWQEMAKQVAHEIKNPLTPMSLMVQNFKRKFDEKSPSARESVIDLCNSISNQIESLIAISQAFSDFSKMPIRNDQTIDMVNELNKTLNIFDNEWITLHTNQGVIYYNLDKFYFGRIITNLMKNAIQAVPDDRQPEIRVTLEKKDDEIILQVQDNGIGVEETKKDNIFEPKFTTKNNGMGLGLAMIKKIITDYHGKIYFKNNPDGVGCTFFVHFPL